MSLFKREPRPLRPELASELNRAASLLKGWTVYGSEGIDIEGLLRRAADAIDDYAALGGAQRSPDGDET